MSFVTYHAEARVRERMGVPKRAVARMAERAFREGAKHSEYSGRMRRYLDQVYLKEHKTNQLRVYNQCLFLFADDVLLTAWQLPQELRKYRPTNTPEK